MSPIEHTVEGADAHLHLRVWGADDAEVVVALHGWPESGRAWQRVAPILADRFRVVVPDNRGFGRSSKPAGTEAYRMRVLLGDLRAVLGWARADSVFLAGHDFGGVVAWGAAMFTPALVRSAMILAAPHPMRMHSVAGDLEQIRRAAYTFLMNVGSRGEALLAAEDFGLLERFAFGQNAAIPVDVREAYRSEWSDDGRFTAMAEWYRAHYTPDLLNPDVDFELPRTTVPVRYVHGQRDFAFIDQLGETNAPYVDGAYDHVRLDASHWMLWEEPHEVARLMIDWFDRHP